MQNSTGSPPETNGGSHQVVIDPYNIKRKLEKVLESKSHFLESSRLSFERFKNEFDLLGRKDVGRLIWRLCENLRLPAVDDETLNEIFTRYDANMDGFLDFEEFSHMYRKLLWKIKDKYYHPRSLRVRRDVFVGRFPLEASDDIRKLFDFKRKIGEGSFGEVHLVEELRSGFTRVCKIINKSQAAVPLEQIESEIDVLKTLDHPNIIKIFDVYEDYNSMYIIMEQCVGGELLDRVVQAQQRNKTLTENYVVGLMQQMLMALTYIHSRKIVHKDLKPDNVLFKDTSVESCIKIIDFGLAEIFKRANEYSHNAAGTILYMAPEVFQRRLHLKCDVWSAGCIMYLLLSGKLPFKGRNLNEIRHAIVSVEPNYETDCRHVSSVAIDLLRKMLMKSAKDRISAVSALRHPWFSKKIQTSLPPVICDNLKTYMLQADLKNVLINLMAHQLDFSGKQINRIDEAFKALDKDQNGTLSADELTEGLKQAGLEDWEISRIIQALDIDESESVSYTEFLAAAYSWKESELNIVWTAFNKLDTDRDGVISLEELTSLLIDDQPGGGGELQDNRLLKRRGENSQVLTSELKDMIKQIDKNGDGKVDWEEFLYYIRERV